jgi:hypothetical protein
MRWALLSLLLLGGILYGVRAFIPSGDEPAPAAQNAALVRSDADRMVLGSAPESGAAVSSGASDPDTAAQARSATSPTPETQTAVTASPDAQSVTVNPETQTVTANDAVESGPAVPPDDPGQRSSGRLLRAAPVHSGPSVSSDTIGYAAAGSEIELVERKDGWARVIDPATSRQGWIYDEHIAMIDGLGAAPAEETAAQDDTEAGALERRAFKPNKSRKKYAKKRWRKPLRFVLRFRRF